jgi:hypothetical protein
VLHIVPSGMREGSVTSAIRLAAMTDTEDAHGIVLEREQHAVVAETEPERTGHIAV